MVKINTTVLTPAPKNVPAGISNMVCRLQLSNKCFLSETEALSALLESRELRTRLGEAGRQRFLEAFDSRIMAARYQAMYESLLNARKPVPDAN